MNVMRVGMLFVSICTATPLYAHQGPAGPSSDHVFVVSGAGKVLLDGDVLCGDVLLPQGQYRFGHRIEGERHAIVLTSSSTAPEGVVVCELRMSVLWASEVAKTTVVFADHVASGTMRLTAVQLRGEDHLHLPFPPRTAFRSTSWETGS
ncbi:MAG: hypothetical protein ABL986_17400 [Vicinamibacterales bacterium]